ncbi:MAG TPA: SRPBCC domain-containing protein [Actinomycetota bacterium]|nr:SRPBCC domain-containing protein [Actinomycetota bacterium]
MSYELRVERLIDAPPEVVFDTLVDPDAQKEIFSGQVEGWSLLESDIDLRVGGTWTTVIGPAEGEPDRLTNVFTAVERPRRLAYRVSMYVGDWGRTIDSEVTITFDDRDGKTLVTIVQGGFETEADRDAYLSGAPGFLDALQKAVASRVAGRHDNG